MQVMASADGNRKPWRLREALRDKGGLSEAEIDELFANTEPLDLVELALSLEEAHGIEIADEDFLNGKSTEDSGDWPS
jgi:acyl carrier protein